MSKEFIRLTLFAIAVTSPFSVQPAQAYTLGVRQAGPNVVTSGSGALDLAGLILQSPFTEVPAGVQANIGFIATNFFTVGGAADIYTGNFTGPHSFGSGGFFAPSQVDDVNGAPVGFGFTLPDGSTGGLIVPVGFAGGDNVSSGKMTFGNATFTSLGLTPGTYVWSWGSGANQNFTLKIGAAALPDGGTTVSLLGFALLGLAALRRKLGC